MAEDTRAIVEEEEIVQSIMEETEECEAYIEQREQDNESNENAVIDEGIKHAEDILRNILESYGDHMILFVNGPTSDLSEEVCVQELLLV
ncbi:unnamed protein product [Nezara viridula]|uniref:Uncharacterized protein n=1 Tax=Nezara viridula TaxID=85310 RepID=A0A9P0E8I1_NEZVI|nr:unnamed protein product [Nezara viridula]